ncbi:hypothetical protein V6Z12_A11G344700 [Gossypium hirsutum]
MAELVGRALDVFKLVGSKASNYLKYQMKFTQYVRDFKQEQADLHAEEADIQQWIKKVEEKLAHAQHVKDKVGKGKYLFCSCLVKLVDESTQAMKEVHAEVATLPTTELVGAANVREEIYQYLMGDDVGLIVLCGIGGIGKTTIMKDVHNRNFSDDEDTIIRAGKVSEMLSGQGRHVLILDDVWRSFSLEEVGILKPTSANGCKLLMTTCLEMIVRSMGFKKVQMPYLSIEEAIKLIFSKVGHDMLPNSTLESLMKLVVRECDGLPLAIVTQAGCMRGGIDPRVWENVVDKLRGYVRNIHDIEDKVYGCLKFSYVRLKQRDQECFLYCALYPEDYEIIKVELIEHWMEEGLIDEMGSRKSIESSGYSILQNLKENCLLEKNSVHMHDVVRDMALHVKWKRFMLNWAYTARMQLKELPNGEEWSEYLEKSLPNSISSLEKFEVLLLLNACRELESFSPVLKLQALKKLNLERTGLKERPQGLEMLLLKKIPTGLLSKLCRLQYFVIHSILKNSEEMRELNKLEVFEGRFCNVGDLSTYAAQRKMLYKYSIFEQVPSNLLFPNIEGYCSKNGVIDCDSLELIEIEHCPKVKQIPLYLPQLEIDEEGKPSPSNPLEEIRVDSKEWWKSMEWDHPIFDVKNVLRPLVKIWNDRIRNKVSV